MKRMLVLLVLLVLLCLLPLSAFAENGPLFPAMDGETGQWGYIDGTGQWRIQPQFDEAYGFRGNYAIAVLYPEDCDADRLWDYDDEGIIDREGNWVLPPEYTIYYGNGDVPIEDAVEDVWIVYKHSDYVWGIDEDGEEVLLSDPREGYFDVSSGYFSGQKWYQVWPYYCAGNSLIPVVDETYRTGYVHRATGELMIPCLYASVYPAVFHEGVAVTCYEEPEEGQTDACFIMTEQGDIVPLADNLEVNTYSDPSEGRVAVEDRETGLHGFVDLQGNPVIEPRFTRAEDFKDGYAAVLFPEGDWGYIDREGNVVSRGVAYDSDWWGPKRSGGVYVLQTGDSEWSAYAVTGEKLFSIRRENLVYLLPPMENGLCWFETDPSGTPNGWIDRKFGLVDLNGNIVSEAIWKLKDFQSTSFEEGLQPVIRIIDGERKMGYLNERGELALPMIYDEAHSFQNGLAQVEIGDQCGYIDHDGHFVFSWTEE